ncbi:hypothetical protein L6164_011281 [Bauhinia variegata]|uniref:Uncharacterized protein n=1 Tax=Bauhinia variegata TaxID=167791 RepID=A0ACB9P5L7_BAUVA|nr:hypothetical protein L6164_011281 [Bauhinia variegata]
MQEIHSMGGTRFFGGGGGGDRRLRQQHHQNHQALKCPRCDSLNTKFCYYNNYNLSQPRHFCKSCRRYWTKGGVLRNVPVGGGCRKSKRSKPKNSSASETSSAPAPVPPSQPSEQERKSNSHSSSESSSLTAANTTAAATEALSAPSSNSASKNNNLPENIRESKFLINHNSNPNLEQSGLPDQGGDCSGIFSDIGSFTSLIASTTTNDTLDFGFGNTADASPFRFTTQGGNDQLSALQNTHQWQHNKVMSTSDHLEFKLSEISDGSLLDQTVPIELSALQSKPNNGGFGSLDWHGGADQGLFDLPNTIDQAYWSQTNWTDQDNLNSSLYLP